ncbi:UNVERIFIED_CONTAM: hypothetical protein NCL1_13685 [Trichonephila clavipes]
MIKKGRMFLFSISEKFTCPSLIGLFMHPKDCSKYYSCTLYIPTLKSCPDLQLFDGVKLSCKPAKDVHCGNRKRPDGKYSKNNINNNNLENSFNPFSDLILNCVTTGILFFL